MAEKIIRIFFWLFVVGVVALPLSSGIRKQPRDAKETSLGVAKYLDDDEPKAACPLAASCRPFYRARKSPPRGRGNRATRLLFH